MESPTNRNLILALGAGLAVLAGIVIAVMLYGKGGKAPEAPPPEKGSLTVDVAEAPTLDPSRRLRCYVNGQFVGESSLEECARKNGVSAQALDVGLDESGALVAAETASLAPPPPVLPAQLPYEEPDMVEEPAPGAQPVDAGPAPIQQASGSRCLRFAGGDWRELSSAISQDACVRLLFDGQCVRPGDAVYGRWGDVSLRLVPGRVEQSNNNRDFRTLMTQGRGCTLR